MMEPTGLLAALTGWDPQYAGYTNIGATAAAAAGVDGTGDFNLDAVADLLRARRQSASYTLQNDATARDSLFGAIDNLLAKLGTSAPASDRLSPETMRDPNYIPAHFTPGVGIVQGSSPSADEPQGIGKQVMMGVVVAAVVAFIGGQHG